MRASDQPVRRQPPRNSKRRQSAGTDAIKIRPMKKKRADGATTGTIGLVNGYTRAQSPAGSGDFDDPHAVSVGYPRLYPYSKC